MLNINGLYRHFKGGLYIVNSIALNEAEPNEADPTVVYTSVATGQTWLRPLSVFNEEIPNREDNTTGQTHRFEPAVNVTSLLSFISTKEIVAELDKRPDNPYEGALNDIDNPNVWDIAYLIGRVTERKDFKTDEVYEEFSPVTPQTWGNYEKAIEYRDLYLMNKPCVIAKRIIKKCAD